MALATITGTIIGGFITKTYSIDIVKEQLKHQLTLVSAEQRIIKHQEAFTEWRKLLAILYSDQNTRNLMKLKCINHGQTGVYPTSRTGLHFHATYDSSKYLIYK